MQAIRRIRMFFRNAHNNMTTGMEISTEISDAMRRMILRRCDDSHVLQLLQKVPDKSDKSHRRINTMFLLYMSAGCSERVFRATCEVTCSDLMMSSKWLDLLFHAVEAGSLSSFAYFFKYLRDRDAVEQGIPWFMILKKYQDAHPLRLPLLSLACTGRLVEIKCLGDQEAKYWEDCSRIAQVLARELPIDMVGAEYRLPNGACSTSCATLAPRSGFLSVLKIVKDRVDSDMWERLLRHGKESALANAARQGKPRTVTWLLENADWKCDDVAWALDAAMDAVDADVTVNVLIDRLAQAPAQDLTGPVVGPIIDDIFCSFFEHFGKDDAHDGLAARLVSDLHAPHVPLDVLMWCVQSGSVRALEFLVDSVLKDASVLAADINSSGLTPLMVAMETQPDKGMVQYICDRLALLGADVLERALQTKQVKEHDWSEAKTVIFRGETHLGVLVRNLEVLLAREPRLFEWCRDSFERFLVSALCRCCRERPVALAKAVKFNCGRCVTALLRVGADPTTADLPKSGCSSSMNALEQALKYGRRAMFHEMIDVLKGVHVRAAAVMCCTLFASKNCLEDMVDFVTNVGLMVNMSDVRVAWMCAVVRFVV